ncbi:Uncharacterized protein TCM_035716 [Theobroma cacao]|uniref:RNase H type-1 domain-containing protein n=1 Tax=Theobroma cacao TaxID=3641 RepID=A0A061FHL5_THECC|nr:Uncharacterized protein TCM_035716 [Theobroma cacao]
MLYWQKPVLGEFKLNVDGSSKCNFQNATSGGILRDYTGSLVFGFYENFGVKNSIQAELLALYKGLILCRDYGISHLWIEMDALVVIQMLTGRYRGSHDSRYLLANIQNLHNYFSYKLSHIFQEGNQAADLLVNLGYEYHSLQVFTVPFGKLQGILRLDKIDLGYV